MTLPNGCKVWLALGADLTANPSSWTWTDVTAYVLYDDGAGVEIEIGYPDGSDDAAPTRVSFTVTNADGRWSPYNAAGAWFGQIGIDTPVRVTFDPGSGAVTRAIAFLADLPLEWTPGGRFRYVRIEALGLLARLESAAALESNTRRLLLTYTNPVAYWPCEDGSGAVRLTSAVPGQPDSVSATDVSLGADSDFAGSKPLPELTTAGIIRFVVAPYERPSPEQWGVAMGIRIPERPATTTGIGLSAYCDSGTIRQWVFEASNTTPMVLRLRGYNSAGVEQLSDAGIPFDQINDTGGSEPFGVQLALDFRVTQVGADVEWIWTAWRAGNGGSTSGGTLSSATLGPPVLLATGNGANVISYTVGHYAVYADDSGDFVAGSTIASGDVGSTTSTRYFSQADAAGIPWFEDGIGDSTQTMGPPPVDTLINVLREPVRLDGGLLWEDPTGLLRFRHLATMVNAPVSLTLAYATQLRQLQPTSAVRSFVNRVTVSRPGGSTVTVDATGPLSPTSRGVVRSKSVELNAETDTNLRYHAQWEAAVGTVQDYRYTADIQLHGGAASKMADWLAMALGNRVQITGPPAWLPPDTIDGYLRGYTEHITRFEYNVSMRLLPYRLHQVFTLEASGNAGRLDTSGSRLLAAITSSGTSAIVGTYGNPTAPTGVAAKWSTTSTPYDLAIRTAERVTCTAVSNNPPTFVAAGAATHADNASLAPALAAGLTVGDLNLCAVAIRSTTATIDDIDGWTRIPIFGSSENVALFARQYVSGDAAPSVDFTGGAAGDTTSAQCCAFRYLQPVVNSRALRLANASAQDIAMPALGVLRNGCVIIGLAWKQDDWTSVAARAGFTEIGEPDSTTGSDQGFVWDYQIQTTATSIAAIPFVVTGGASAISMGGMVALLGDVQTLTLTRNVNSISGGVAHPAGSEVDLWRGGVVMRP